MKKRLNAFSWHILLMGTACLGSFALGIYVLWQTVEWVRLLGPGYLLLGTYAAAEVIRAYKIERNFRQNLALLRKARDESLAERDRNGDP